MADSVDNNQSFHTIDGDFSKGLILLCDHASNRLPRHYGSLGLGAAQLERHIAYDIGVEALTTELAVRLQVPAIMTSFSRLLIDPNRGPDDPTLIMQLSDGAVIKANYRLDEQEIARRKTEYYQPYHRAIGKMIDTSIDAGVVPAIFSIHSFTDKWKGTARPWHVAILWDNDARLAGELLRGLKGQKDIIVGDNQPYDGALGNDTMYTHCTRRGLAHALIEVRQDLISQPDGIEEWVDRIANVLEPAIGLPQMHRIIHNGSRTGSVDYYQRSEELSGEHIG